MKVKNLFNFVSNFRYPLYSLLFVWFIGLVSFNNLANFTRTTPRISDAAPFSSKTTELSPLAPVQPIKTSASLASVPRTSTRYIFGSTSKLKASTLFTIRNVEDVADPSVDAGTGVKRYNYRGKNRFLYGHSNLAFAPLKTLYQGDTFTANLDGVTKTYRVAVREVYKKSDLDSNSSLRAAIYSAAYYGNTYDLSLMTCGNGGNDDSNYRLVLFATAE